MKASPAQLHQIQDVAARLLTRDGADQLIRALLHIDGGGTYRGERRALAADTTLIEVLEPLCDRSTTRLGIKPTDKPARPLKPCGTHAAYMRHLRNYEDPCDACNEANREKSKAQREGKG